MYPLSNGSVLNVIRFDLNNTPKGEFLKESCKGLYQLFHPKDKFSIFIKPLINQQPANPSNKNPINNNKNRIKGEASRIANFLRVNFLYNLSPIVLLFLRKSS
ncbi:hypothetical protein PMALA_073950 [Plasmodium malariae]|uniref:Uncharacterized protein n=1 Tax=Plasmodium malariae TaxID=5858 RepID=A0A1A8X471_PLAMA|nr:hypothetical protein PMALA_073950 [Plasmodium malariae]